MITTEKARMERRALGWGIRCRPVFPGISLGQDLLLERGEGGLDLARVEGRDNLTQVLTLALTTRLGDDLFNTRFGFDGLESLTSPDSPVMVRERVRIAVIKLLTNEPRVRRIIDVKLEGGQLEPATGSQRTLDVRVEFEAVSGERHTLALQEAIPGG